MIENHGQGWYNCKFEGYGHFKGGKKSLDRWTGGGVREEEKEGRRLWCGIVGFKGQYLDMASFGVREFFVVGHFVFLPNNVDQVPLSPWPLARIWTVLF